MVTDRVSMQQGSPFNKMEIELAESVAVSKRIIAHLVLNRPRALQLSEARPANSGIVYSFTPITSRLRKCTGSIANEAGVDGALRTIFKEFGALQCSCGGEARRLSYHKVLARHACDGATPIVVWAEKMLLPQHALESGVLADLSGTERFIAGLRLLSVSELADCAPQNSDFYAVRNSLSFEDALSGTAPPADIITFLFSSRNSPAIAKINSEGAFFCSACGSEISAGVRQLYRESEESLLSQTVTELLSWCDRLACLEQASLSIEIKELSRFARELAGLGLGSLNLNTPARELSTAEASIYGIWEGIHYSLSEVTFIVDHLCSILSDKEAQNFRNSLSLCGTEYGFAARFLDCSPTSLPRSESVVPSLDIESARLNIFRGPIGSGKSLAISKLRERGDFKKVLHLPLEDVVLPVSTTIAGFLGLDREFASLFASTSHSRAQSLTVKNFLPAADNLCNECLGIGFHVLDALKSRVAPRTKIALLSSLERFAFEYFVCARCEGAGFSLPMVDIEGVSFKEFCRFTICELKNIQWIPPKLLPTLSYLEMLGLASRRADQLMIGCSRADVSLIRIVKELSALKSKPPILCTFEHPSIFLEKESAGRLGDLLRHLCDNGVTCVCEDNTDRLINGDEVIVQF